ncbi:cache domain-containing protein [Candidatus Reidiella endopervernicosa]|uniref:Double Cache domain-containing protein n=1 Tax=Candidatus Reidiella endopervernicosa TaxID=2738883 RepID=A0A6N0HU25_9GAMM|nr:cache domain-containing protein [Candidatus Reidiella endopervernicosa]QKQ25820.1 hypothetical protein HUE57_05645 [Candidatus Reidiella endopervernicosa]
MALSVVILLVDLLFVLINVHADNRAIEQSLKAQSRELRSGFELAVSLTYRNMMQLASYVSQDPEVQALMRKAKHAVAAEGDGPGGERAAEIRSELYALLGPRWRDLTQRYDVRQLHFHLGPGSTSFLRVHKPDKFGDTMHALRYTIVDTNAEKSARSGFETGRVYSGLRGVVPMFAENGASVTEHLGALEVGTSFSNILHLIERELQSDITVLLKREHAEQAMWPEAITRIFGSSKRVDGYFVEATSSPRQVEMLREVVSESLIDDVQSRWRKVDNRHYLHTLFPLYDY